MSIKLTREEFATPEGRRRAWASWFLADHGFLREIVRNTHEIAPGVWRTFQPSPKRLHEWADRGIRTVINLRGIRKEEAQDGFYLLEEEVCAERGMELVNFRAYSREAPSRDFIFGLKELFETAEYPVMFHCKSGADRAGVVAALYEFLVAGKPLEEALEQLSLRYGHVKSGKTGVLDFYFEEYIRYAEAEGADKTPEHFLGWAENVADPQDIKARFKPTLHGRMLTEWILRRE